MKDLTMLENFILKQSPIRFLFFGILLIVSCGLSYKLGERSADLDVAILEEHCDAAYRETAKAKLLANDYLAVLEIIKQDWLRCDNCRKKALMHDRLSLEKPKL